MIILICNDDGYRAPGIAYLEKGLSVRGHQTQVVAPENNCSGASNSISLNRPLRCRTADNGYRYVNGTPSDCVQLAVIELLDRTPDIVVSGINAGPNMGDDVIYSGTIAAAIQGRLLGLNSMAVSLALNGCHHYETASKAATWIAERIGQQPSAANLLLNVNVPDVPWKDICGFRATRLGNRHKRVPFIVDTDPNELKTYRFGPVGLAKDDGLMTDFRAVRDRFVSVSPLQLDLTDRDRLRWTEEWLHDR